MRKIHTLILSIFMLLGVSGKLPSMQQGKGQISLEIDPRVIVVDLFYRGSDVAVRAEVPPECESVAIKLQGNEKQMELNRKGKVAFLWLNVDRVTVKYAPRIYLLQASEELPLLAPAEELARWGLGYEALRDTIRFESRGNIDGAYFDDFVALKEHEGAYNVKTARILHKSGEGRRYVSAVLEIPPMISPGRYDVRLFCFGDGKLLGSMSTSLSVKDTGFPHFIKTIAYEHAAWYGILAILVAIAAGFGIGFLFAGRMH